MHRRWSCLLVAHEAIENPTQWAVFLARFADEVNAHRTAIVSKGPDGLPVEIVSATRGVPTEGSLQNWLQDAGTPRGSPPSAVVATRANMCDARIRAFSAVVCDECRATCTLAAVRQAGSSEFSSEDRITAAMLVPHVRHALILGRKLQKASSERSAALAALDEVPCGVMLLDQDGALLAANKGARRMLERGDGLRMDGGRVSATSGREKEQLREVVRQVGAKPTTLPDAAVTLTLHRSDQQSALLARITAAPRPAGSVVFAHDRASVMLFAIDPDCRPVIHEQPLRQVYGLTKSEAHFAALLATGEDLDKIADRLCVSRNTVRTHLQRVYMKTDTRRQGDLIRFLLAGFAGAP